MTLIKENKSSKWVKIAVLISAVAFALFSGFNYIKDKVKIPNLSFDISSDPITFFSSESNSFIFMLFIVIFANIGMVIYKSIIKNNDMGLSDDEEEEDDEDDYNDEDDEEDWDEEEEDDY